MSSKYANRAVRERQYKEEPLKAPIRILSGNKKTGVSINLPLINCRPSKRCADTCYACEGHIALPNSIRKTLYVDKLLREGDLDRLIAECRKEWEVRLCGSGDFVAEHIPSIFRLADECPKTILWGFTRNRPVAEQINAAKKPNLSIILSYDSTMSDEYIEGYEGPIAYGPRQAEDIVDDDKRIIVVFPEHHQAGPHWSIPDHRKDCPAVRMEHKEDKHGACTRCRRCFDPFQAMEKGL